LQLFSAFFFSAFFFSAFFFSAFFASLRLITSFSNFVLATIFEGSNLSVAHMYQIDHLLALLTDEKAKELQFRAGTSPMMVSENEQHLLQGPPITDDEAMRLLLQRHGSSET
jgi:hypothetical protein